MTNDEKKAYIRQMNEAERLMDLREQAILIGAIDAITLAYYPHTGPSKFVAVSDIWLVKNILSGRIVPFEGAAGYLDNYIKSQNFSVLATDIIGAAGSNGTQWYKPVFTAGSCQLTVLP